VDTYHLIGDGRASPPPPLKFHDPVIECCLLLLWATPLCEQVLVDPCEIQVGGRSVVNSDITQLIEIRPEADRFLRLLELLGEWYEEGKIIIFVQSQASG
jgi:hypothetical protein